MEREVFMMMWLALFIVLGVVLFAYLIDRRNKKLNNSSLKTISSHAKPGESTNYMMGDNRYINGGE
ncbi:MAG TPA: hypothetical protein VFX18_01425 [Candidatus Nitrosocosmicus sp.]|nr:hypothetical protein [Candidatus Nitrosocosmicus sp.]